MTSNLNEMESIAETKGYKDLKWFFANEDGGTEMGPNDPSFTMFNQTPYPSLVREAIQNSLDVADPESDKPVVVKFEYSSLPEDRFPNFFELKKHVEGIFKMPGAEKADSAKRLFMPIIDRLNSMHAQLPYLCISDYNTIGMDYVPEDSPFYGFVHTVGYNFKSDTSSGGHFGYGKAAYFNCSPLRTILVSTMTKEKKLFFQGVSKLCTHKILENGNLVKKRETGYYDNNNGEPVADVRNIAPRFQREEPGTSFYLMGTTGDKDEQDAAIEEMTKAVLLSFWFSIYSKNLEIVFKGGNNTEIYITAENLEQLLLKYFSVNDYSSTNPIHFYRTVANQGADENYFHKREEVTPLGTCSFYLHKFKKQGRDYIQFMRNKRMLIYTRGYNGGRGFVGVFVCESDTGSEYLKEMEDPTHTQWDSRNWKGSSTSDINPLGVTIEKAYNNFVENYLDEFFKAAETGEFRIEGLDKYISISEELLNDDDINETNPFVGIVTNQNSTEPGVVQETKPKSDLPQQSKPHRALANQGDAIDPKNGPIVPGESGPDTAGRQHTGHGPRPITPSTGTKPVNPDPKGKNGSYNHHIPITYRVSAFSRNDYVYHKLLIHSKEDASSAIIEIRTLGEDGKAFDLSIESAESYPIEGNKIKSVALHKDIVNTIEIKFNDKMKHSIQIDAYENR